MIRKLFSIQALLFAVVFLGGCETEDSVKASQAESAYQNGNYSAAERIYSDIALKGTPNAHLLYNLASAQFRQGKLGPAIANLLTAQRLSPTDPDIEANLKYLRSKVSSTEIDTPVVQPAWLVLFGWREVVDETILTYIVLFLWLGNCWILSREKRGRFLNSLALFNAALFLSSAGALLFTRVDASNEVVWQIPNEDAPTGVAVVLRGDTAARSDRSADSSVVAMLGEGVQVNTGEIDGTLVQVFLAHDRRGWVEKTAVQLIGVYE